MLRRGSLTPPQILKSPTSNKATFIIADLVELENLQKGPLERRMCIERGGHFFFNHSSVISLVTLVIQAKYSDVDGGVTLNAPVVQNKCSFVNNNTLKTNRVTTTNRGV